MRSGSANGAPPRREPTLPAYLALAAGVASLGFSGIFVRWAGAPGIVTSFYRMAVAVVLMAPPFYHRARKGMRWSRPGLWMAAVGGLLFAADLALWATGVVMSGATNPTLLANTAPLWVGVGARVLFRERLAAGFWLGLFVALTGAVLVLGLDTLRATTFGLGSLLGLLAAVFYGGYFLATQRGRETLDPVTYSWASAVSAGAALLALSLLFRLPLTGYTTRTYLNFLALGLVSQGVGYLAVSYALGRLPASLVAPTLLGQPVATALLAGPLLGERLVPGQMLGGAAVLAGVYVVHRSRSRRA